MSRSHSSFHGSKLAFFLKHTVVGWYRSHFQGALSNWSIISSNYLCISTWNTSHQWQCNYPPLTSHLVSTANLLLASVAMHEQISKCAVIFSNNGHGSSLLLSKVLSHTWFLYISEECCCTCFLFVCLLSHLTPPYDSFKHKCSSQGTQGPVLRLHTTDNLAKSY